jgi:hypothetical protein
MRRSGLSSLIVDQNKGDLDMPNVMANGIQIEYEIYGTSPVNYWIGCPIVLLG